MSRDRAELDQGGVTRAKGTEGSRSAGAGERPAGDAPGVIGAAGGLVWRQSAQGLRLAVIHRPRHHDWTLPKGKLRRDESWERAARREVGEETGCRVRPGRFAGCVTYPVAGATKVVRYWHMHAVGACRFRPSEEVDRVEWLTPGAALERLDYAGERALVEAYREGPGQRPGPGRWLPGALRAQRTRLDCALAVRRRELDWAASRARADDPLVQAWLDYAEGTLREAEEAAAADDVDTGWALVHALERSELEVIAALDPARFARRAGTILREARSKLEGWRLGRVEALLGGIEADAAAAPEPAVVADAWGLLHEHFQNVYHKITVLWRRLILAGVALFVLLLALLLALWTGAPLAAPGDAGLVTRMVVLGAAGALVSVLMPRGPGAAARIPDQLVGQANALVRPVVGAVMAVVVYLLMRSGVLAPFGPAPGAGQFLLLAFVAGFADRFVIGVIDRYTERIAGKADGERRARPRAEGPSRAAQPRPPNSQSRAARKRARSDSARG